MLQQTITLTDALKKLGPVYSPKRNFLRIIHLAFTDHSQLQTFRRRLYLRKFLRDFENIKNFDFLAKLAINLMEKDREVKKTVYLGDLAKDMVKADRKRAIHNIRLQAITEAHQSWNKKINSLIEQEISNANLTDIRTLILELYTLKNTIDDKLFSNFHNLGKTALTKFLLLTIDNVASSQDANEVNRLADDFYNFTNYFPDTDDEGLSRYVRKRLGTDHEPELEKAKIAWHEKNQPDKYIPQPAGT